VLQIFGDTYTPTPVSFDPEWLNSESQPSRAEESFKVDYDPKPTGCGTVNALQFSGTLTVPTQYDIAG